MPYCQQCRTNRELVHMQATPSPYIRQGKCAHCNATVHFFANIPTEQSRATPTTPPQPSPAHQVKPARTWQALRPHFEKIPLAKPANSRRFTTFAAPVLLIAFVILLCQQLLGQPFPGDVNASRTFLRVSNLTPAIWKNLKLTLNGRYTYSANQDHAKPIVIISHGSSYFAYNHFVKANGQPFDPTKERPASLHLEAIGEKGHLVCGDVDLHE